MKQRALLVLIVLISIFDARSAPVYAQAPRCGTYFPPSSGWSILIGSITGSNVLSGTGHTLAGSPNSTIDMRFNNFGHAVYIYSVDFYWYTTPSLYPSDGVVTTILTAATSGLPGDTNQESDHVINTTDLTWVHTTFNFTQLPADALELTLSNASTSTYLTLGEVHVCLTDAIPFTSTPSNTPSTTPSPTGGPSPTPSNTPLPPTATPTPTPSNTPISVGGLTVTPSLTMTLAASPGSTLGIGKAIFATVPAPDQCSDAFNPCGALPYPVPPLATLNLPSPTAVPITPFAGTPGAGTPTGTSTGTPTLESTTGAVIQSFATNAQAAVQQIEITPGLNGPPGTGIGISDLNNTAHQVGSYVGDFFGIIRAIQFFFLGKTGTLIAFLILILLFIILVRLICWAIPIVSNFAKFIIWIIGAIIP